MLLTLFVVLFLLCFFCFSVEKCAVLVFIWYPTISILPIFQGASVATLFIYMIFFRMLKKKGKKSISSFPFLLPFLLSILSYFVSAVSGYKLALTFIYWIEEYLLVVVLWCIYTPTRENNKFLFISFMSYLLLLDVYAVYEAITVHNPFIEYLSSCGIENPMQNEKYVRYGIYRSQSLTRWTEIMGAVSGFGALFLAFAFFENFVKPMKMLYFTWLFGIAGVFISGARAIMVTVSLGVVGFVKKIFKLEYLLSLLVVILIAASLTGDFFSQVWESLIHQDEAGGSDVDMRFTQFMVAYKFWMDAPILGNGLDYTGVVIRMGVGLLGAESIMYRLFIDRGVIGFFSFVLLYVYSVFKLYRMGYLNFSFILISFCFAKILTLIYGVEEAYAFGYVILLMKMKEGQKKEDLKLLFYSKCRMFTSRSE